MRMIEVFEAYRKHVDEALAAKVEPLLLSEFIREKGIEISVEPIPADESAKITEEKRSDDSTPL